MYLNLRELQIISSLTVSMNYMLEDSGQKTQVLCLEDDSQVQGGLGGMASKLEWMHKNKDMVIKKGCTKNKRPLKGLTWSKKPSGYYQQNYRNNSWNRKNLSGKCSPLSIYMPNSQSFLCDFNESLMCKTSNYY